MKTIKKIEREDVGGGMINTNIYMRDGSIVVICHDAVYVYDNILNFSELTHSKVYVIDENGFVECESNQFRP